MKPFLAFFLVLLAQIGWSQLTEVEGDIRISNNLPRLELYDFAVGEQRVEGSLRESADNIILSALVGNLIFKTNGLDRLSIDHQLGTTTVFGDLSLQKEVHTLWGHIWVNKDHDKIWMQNSWSNATGDRLYVGTTGNGTNADRGALLITTLDGIQFGKGSDNGTELSEVNAKIEENGDLWLKGRLRSSGTLHITGLDFEKTAGGDLQYSYLGTGSNNVIGADDMNMIAHVPLPVGARIKSILWWGTDGGPTEAHMDCRIMRDYMAITANLQTFFVSELFGSQEHASGTGTGLVQDYLSTDILIEDDYFYYIRCTCEDSDGQRLKLIELEYTFDPN